MSDRLASEWDFIVVGGGTAGCILATRLSERPGMRVMLIEAGGNYPRLRLSVPLPSLQQTTNFSWRHFTTQQGGLVHRRVSLPLGRVLGGSSSVNAMIYCRGTAADYDGWSRLGNVGWSFAEVLPYFRRVENYHGQAGAYRGRGGPIDVARPRHRAPFSEAFVEACLEAGIRYNEDFNSEQQEGAGFFDVTQRCGERVSTAQAYLAPARRREGLQVLTGTTVRRIVFEGERAVGVECDTQSGARRTFACGGLVLCAGVIGSARLLMVSGVGNASELRSVGLNPWLDLPGVGKNLQDHVRLPVLYATPRKSPGRMQNWLPAAADYAVRRRGVLASNCCESGAFVRSAPQVEAPDLQFVTHFQSALYAGAVDLQVCLQSVESRGEVSLSSADPSVPPRINPGYLSATSDMTALVRGVRMARALARTRTLRRFPLDDEIMPGLDVDTDEEIKRYIRASADTCYHAVGTCKMGTDSMAVVDPRLRVRGIEGLRIADASVMPCNIHGNTFAPVAMIAERAADMILEDHAT